MHPATAILWTNGYFVPSNIQSQIQDLSPAGINNVPVCVSFSDRPFRFSKEPAPGELFVNNSADYLTANSSDIQVSTTARSAGDYALGGVVPPELSVGAGEVYLDINGFTLAVYNPASLNLIGHDNLTGVYQ